MFNKKILIFIFLFAMLLKNNFSFFQKPSYIKFHYNETSLSDIEENSNEIIGLLKYKEYPLLFEFNIWKYEKNIVKNICSSMGFYSTPAMHYKKILQTYTRYTLRLNDGNLAV